MPKLKPGSLMRHADGSIYLCVEGREYGPRIIDLTIGQDCGECPTWTGQVEDGTNPSVTVLGDNMCDIIKRVTNE